MQIPYVGQAIATNCNLPEATRMTHIVAGRPPGIFAAAGRNPQRALGGRSPGKLQVCVLASRALRVACARWVSAASSST